MRDTLPNTIWENKAGIVNLDRLYGDGTHWVCYIKRNDKVSYFDGFLNLKPLVKLVKYLSP